MSMLVIERKSEYLIHAVFPLSVALSFVAGVSDFTQFISLIPLIGLLFSFFATMLYILKTFERLS